MNKTIKRQSVIPYLFVNGASFLLEFLQKVFEAKLIRLVLTEDNLISHAEIQIGSGRILLADNPEAAIPCNATIIVCVDNADHTFNKALAEGAKIVSELTSQSISRTGSITDPFGITWWITSPICA